MNQIASSALPGAGRILAILAALLLGACSFAPVYQRPAAPVAPTYGATDTGSAGQGKPAVAEIGWRDFLSDPRLARLIELALDNNRDLRVAVLNVELARAQYRIQRSELLPTLDANAGDARARTPASLRLPGEPAVLSEYSAGVGVSAYEVDLFGRVRSLKDAALASYLATEQARRSAQISLVAQLADAYFTTQAYAEQLEVTRQTLATREDSFRLAQRQFDAGTMSAFDLSQEETLVQTARADLASQTRARDQALNALTLVVGQPLPADLPPARPLMDESIANDFPAGLPSDLLGRRPDVLEAEQQLIAQNANIGAARAAFFPRITLTGSYGFSSSQLTDLFRGESRSWSFLPQVDVPIFDGGRNRATLDAAKVSKNIAVANYEKSIQSAFREVADGLAARSTFDQQLHAQESLVIAETRRFELARMRYTNGVASYLDLLDAQRELFSAQQTLILVRLGRLTNLIDLYRALGGGWIEQSPVASAPVGGPPSNPSGASASSAASTL